MWTVKHDSRTKEHVHLLARDIAHGTSSGGATVLDAQNFPAFAECLRQSIARALTSLAQAINVKSAICSLPPELLSHIASFLPLPALCTASSVCKHWNTVMFEDARLWHNVSVHLCANASRWEPSLSPLLARSRMFPVRLELSVQCASHSLDPTLKLLEQHIPHLVALSLGIPPGALIKFCALLQSTPAPVLETLRVLSPQLPRALGMPLFGLPAGLFAAHAPRLETMYLQSALVSPDIGPATARVKHLTYEHSTSPVSAATIYDCTRKCFPALESLVLTQGFVRGMNSLAEINPLPLDGIRLFCTLDTDPEATTAFLELVPSTASVTISLAADIPMGAVQTVDIPERLRDIFRKHAPIQRLDIRVQQGWVHGNSSADIPQICTLSINGARVAVDVYCAFVTAMFAKNRDEMGLQHVSKLFISKTLYEILETAWPVLTALRELTIYVDAVDEDVPGTLEDNECKLNRICFVEDLRVRPPPHELILSVPCIRETMAIIQASIRADIPHLVLSGIPILRPRDFSDAPTVSVSLEPHVPRENYRWWWELGLLGDCTLHV